MKIYYFFFSFLLFGYTLEAQPYKLWATYYGDGMVPIGTETSNVVYDPAGFVYIAGLTFDSTISLATPGSFKSHMSGFADAYLAKFDTLGNRIWGTYIGNEDGDLQPRLHLDNNGNVLVAGITKGQQNLISTPGTYRPIIPSSGDNYSYLIKFNPDGQRLWGTYLNIYDQIDTTTRYHPAAITSDAQGNIIVGGRAIGQRPFPSGSTHMPVPNDGSNGFILKLDATGNFIWGTYFGGENLDDVASVNCDLVGNIYFSGLTKSTTGIATLGAAYPVFTPGIPPNDVEGYIAKMSANGTLQWGTYTNGIIGTGGVKAISNGCYLAGTTTRDTGIATPGTYLQQYSDSIDYCLTRWDDNGQKLWGTYYGGTGKEYHYGTDVSGGTDVGAAWKTHNISLDPAGNIMIVGGTHSLENIKVGCTYSGWREGVPQGNGFMAKFYPDGNIMWGSYYDIPLMGVACASNGNSFYMVTGADLDSLATPGAFQETKTAGTMAGYLAKMEGDYLCPDIEVLLDYNEGEGLLSTDSGFYDYQWFRNGDPVTGANDYQYAPVDSGTYYVRYKNACDCIYVSDTIWVSGGTGIGEVKHNDLKVTLYPNPNSGIFTITGEVLKGNSKINYTLSNVIGKAISTGYFYTNSPSFSHKMQFSDLAVGVYLLKLSDEDNKQSAVKFSVSR